VQGPNEQGVIERLERELKALIVASVRLKDLHVAELSEDTPLFRDGLGLDSIDALELAVTLHRRYGIRMPIDEDVASNVMFSIRTLALFLAGSVDRSDTVS
jgi:acyl carrier protein